MKLSDLIIDPASLGKRFWLVDVIPSYAYQNGQRTDTVTGYRYTVALPDKGLDKINVRIDGEQRMDAPDGFIEVRIDGLEPYLYWSGGEYQLGARAKGIAAVNAGKGCRRRPQAVRGEGFSFGEKSPCGRRPRRLCPKLVLP